MPMKSNSQEMNFGYVHFGQEIWPGDKVMTHPWVMNNHFES